MVGTNMYNQSEINPNVWVKLTNADGFADDCELRGTTTLPTEEKLFSRGCQLKIEDNATLFLNSADDGEAPSWVQIGGSSFTLNGLTGAVFIQPGSGIDVQVSGQNITISNTAPTVQALIGSTSGITSNPTPGGTQETWFGYQAGQAGASTDQTVMIGIQAGSGASTASRMVAIGVSAGSGASSATDSVMIGQNAGYTAANAQLSTFVGPAAGYLATSADHSTFIGGQAGIQASGATYSFFGGYQAGKAASAATESVIIGSNAGESATNANGSVFIGRNAGFAAGNAANTIAIGKYAGYFDAVDNTVSGSSILIGNSTSTGGFQDSIALGYNATNTRSGQLMLSSGITKVHLAIEAYIDAAAAITAGLVSGDWYYNTTDDKLTLIP